MLRTYIFTFYSWIKEQFYVISVPVVDLEEILRNFLWQVENATSLADLTHTVMLSGGCALLSVNIRRWRLVQGPRPRCTCLCFVVMCANRVQGDATLPRCWGRSGLPPPPPRVTLRPTLVLSRLGLGSRKRPPDLVCSRSSGPRPTVLAGARPRSPVKADR